MRKARTLLFLGIWVAILPYLGFPYEWKTILFVITGLMLMYLGYEIYKKHKIVESRNQKFENFSENKEFYTPDKTQISTEHEEYMNNDLNQTNY